MAFKSKEQNCATCEFMWFTGSQKTHGFCNRFPQTFPRGPRDVLRGCGEYKAGTPTVIESKASASEKKEINGVKKPVSKTIAENRV